MRERNRVYISAYRGDAGAGMLQSDRMDWDGMSSSNGTGVAPGASVIYPVNVEGEGTEEEDDDDEEDDADEEDDDCGGDVDSGDDDEEGGLNQHCCS